MNRKNEFEAMIEELNQPAPGLEATLDRAYKKKRKRKLWELTKKDEDLEDVIVPIDECLLNDIDEQSTLFDTISIHID